MFEIKEVSNIEATDRFFWAGVLSAGSAVGSAWLVASIPVILAC